MSGVVAEAAYKLLLARIADLGAKNDTLHAKLAAAEARVTELEADVERRRIQVEERNAAKDRLRARAEKAEAAAGQMRAAPNRANKTIGVMSNRERDLTVSLQKIHDHVFADKTPETAPPRNRLQAIAGCVELVLGHEPTDAGRGWVSPEAHARVVEALRALFDAADVLQPKCPDAGCRLCCALTQARAALTP